MEQQTKNTLLQITLTIILVATLFYSQYTTTKQLKNEINTTNINLNTAITQTKQDIITLQNYVDTENQKIGTEINSRVTYLENKLNITKKEQQQEIKKVSGRIEQVQQESTQKFTQFEDQIKTIKIKNKDFSGIIQDVLKTVVTIKTDKSIGSGVIISEKGYIVTNYHVLDGAKEAGLRTYDNKVYPIQVIGTEKNTDLAVIKIMNPQTTPQFLEFETMNIQTGDKVIAVGNPAGLEFSVSEGIISATDRTNQNGIKYIQTDVPINPGNSGGPLVNIKSKIVGINTMKKEGMEGLGFAIHADVVKQITNQIIQQYEQAQTTN